jgi:hypothetical protein
MDEEPAGARCVTELEVELGELRRPRRIGTRPQPERGRVIGVRLRMMLQELFVLGSKTRPST